MKVCVFGAGNMGARITEVFLNAGHDVTMIDIKPEFTERGKTVITHDYEFLVSKGKMTAERKDELLASLKTSVDRKDAANADFVMEVILERMDLKKDLLEDLDKICLLYTSEMILEGFRRIALEGPDARMDLSLIHICHERLWPVISVLTAYLCCQLRRWLALIAVAIFSGGDTMQYAVEIIVTVPLLILPVSYTHLDVYKRQGL